MRRRILLIAFAALLVAAPAASAADPPAGVSGLALSARVDVAWVPVAGATSYMIYRGTSPTAVTTLLTPAGVGGTSWSDTTVANGTVYYYVVRSRTGTTQSANSSVIEARPRTRSCSTGNATRLENCFAGDAGWRTTSAVDMFNGGIEGYATTQSVDGGATIDVKVQEDWDTTFRAEIYRNGYYGGAGARLISSVHGVAGTRQPGCNSDFSTGLTECSDWAVNLRIPTTTSWPSGVYLLRLVREDNGHDAHVLIVVRDDDRNSEALYGLPVTTYQAYNNWGGRNTYDWGSSGGNTVAGTARAVAVSFDRPYSQVWNPYLRDWYTKVDYPTIYWLEQMGYDVAYIANTDLERLPNEPRDHRVYLAGAHDEYWSAGMRNALEAARSAGTTNLLFMGANEVYWKVRFTAGASGALDRTMVVYKSTQSGPADPSGIPTGTWRDPAGANKPENGLLGAMYVGDNDYQGFPLVVGASEGADRTWRFTGLDSQAAGSQTVIGNELVGWEWNSRYANGAEPAGLKTLASSPVTGTLIQGNGAFGSPGSAVAQVTSYTASSGSKVFNTGTINWALGLANNAFGVGEPDIRIQQATTNVLLDMGATPASPTSGITVSANWPPVVSSTVPAEGEGIGGSMPITATFNRPMDATSLTSSTFTITAPSGAVAPATVTYDSATRTASATPTSPLAANTIYTARLTTGVRASDGSPLAAAKTWTFTTAACPCTLYPASSAPAVTGNPAADGRTGAGPFTLELGVKIVADGPTNITSVRFFKSPGETGTHVGRIWNASGVQLAQVTFANETPSGWQQQALGTPLAIGPGTTYTVSVNANERYVITVAGLATAKAKAGVRTVVGTNGVYGLAGGTFPSASWNQSEYFVDVGFSGSNEALPLTVTSTSPANAAVGVPATTTVRATFDRAVNASTVSASSFTLSNGTSTVAAAVSYDSGTRTATLTPSAALAGATRYTASLAASVAATDGGTLDSAYTWSFTTEGCPCQLFDPASTPQFGGNPVQDGRSSGAPYSYELGVKVQVDRAAQITAIRYYKDPLETGTHVGRVWSSTGTLLASVTFTAETASGWQQQTLAAPLPIAAGTTYVVSANRNDMYGFAPSGLASAIVNGPLSSVVGSNGVYGLAAGQFPNNSWNNSNYYADVVVQ